MTLPLSSILYPLSSPRPRRAFTLVELLIVLALIVLALAAAVPAFNYITGSRSADAAENQIAAMLTRARAAAVRDARLTGVAFFVNPQNGRATLAIVSKADGDTPYYRGWAESALITPPAITGAPTYLYDQHVTAVVKDQTSAIPAPFNNRLIVGTFSEKNLAGATASDSTAPPNRPGSGAWTNTYWNGESSTQFLDFPTDSPSEFETLPPGVAVQLLNDPKDHSDPTKYNQDRYVQTGVILFDEQGRLTSTPFAFTSSSQIYKLLKSATVISTQIPTLPTTLYSQLGVIIYDRAAFLAQPNASEGDLVWQTDLLLTPPAALTESVEEKWLDENTTPLFVNRYNGTLIKGQ